METKDIKLSPKKGGHGHITSYSVNLGSAEVRSCGFLDENGSRCRSKRWSTVSITKSLSA